MHACAEARLRASCSWDIMLCLSVQQVHGNDDLRQVSLSHIGGVHACCSSAGRVAHRDVHASVMRAAHSVSLCPACVQRGGRPRPHGCIKMGPTRWSTQMWMCTVLPCFSFARQHWPEEIVGEIHRRLRTRSLRRIAYAQPRSRGETDASRRPRARGGPRSRERPRFGDEACRRNWCVSEKGFSPHSWSLSL